MVRRQRRRRRADRDQSTRRGRRTTRSTPTMAGMRTSRIRAESAVHLRRRREDAHHRQADWPLRRCRCGRFTINGRQTIVYANVNNLLGFEVADLTTGKVLHRVAVEGLKTENSPVHGTPSHGIAMTADETEIRVADNTNHFLHIFDATKMPPVQKTRVHLRDEPGWIAFSLDGRTAFASTGDVVDALQGDCRDARGRARPGGREREGRRDRLRRRQARPCIGSSSVRARNGDGSALRCHYVFGNMQDQFWGDRSGKPRGSERLHLDHRDAEGRSHPSGDENATKSG